jgi:hypothetical protein
VVKRTFAAMAAGRWFVKAYYGEELLILQATYLFIFVTISTGQAIAAKVYFNHQNLTLLSSRV